MVPKFGLMISDEIISITREDFWDEDAIIDISNQHLVIGATWKNDAIAKQYGKWGHYEKSNWSPEVTSDPLLLNMEGRVITDTTCNAYDFEDVEVSTSYDDLLSSAITK